MSLREDFAKNIVEVLTNMDDPRPGLVTREPFDVEKLAITQFPAILVSSGDEERADNSMGIFRQGNIIYTIRGFVRGNEIDRLRNDLIERIEETLDTDRSRGTTATDMTTQVTRVTVADRFSPLGEVSITVQVRYRYRKGTN